jgi:hypothetical protein
MRMRAFSACFSVPGICRHQSFTEWKTTMWSALAVSSSVLKSSVFGLSSDFQDVDNVAMSFPHAGLRHSACKVWAGHRSLFGLILLFPHLSVHACLSLFCMFLAELTYFSQRPSYQDVLRTFALTVLARSLIFHLIPSYQSSLWLWMSLLIFLRQWGQFLSMSSSHCCATSDTGLEFINVMKFKISDLSRYVFTDSLVSWVLIFFL